MFPSCHQRMVILWYNGRLANPLFLYLAYHLLGACFLPAYLTDAVTDVEKGRNSTPLMHFYILGCPASADSSTHTHLGRCVQGMILHFMPSVGTLYPVFGVIPIILSFFGIFTFHGIVAEAIVLNHSQYNPYLYCLSERERGRRGLL